jgi:hypothetical protein
MMRRRIASRSSASDGDSAKTRLDDRTLDDTSPAGGAVSSPSVLLVVTGGLYAFMTRRAERERRRSGFCAQRGMSAPGRRPISAKVGGPAVGITMQLQRRRGHLGLAAAAAGVLLSGSTTARAASLRWTSPPDCARADAVEARIEELAGRQLETVESPNFEVTVERAADNWTLALITETAAGASRRDLSGRSCSEVTDAAAVAMAMAIRAALPERSPEPVASPDVTPPAVEARPEATPSSAPSRAEHPGAKQAGAGNKRPELGGVVGVAALLDTGALPAPTLGVGVGGGLRWGWLRAELQGAAFAPRTADGSGGQRGTFDLLTGAFLGCVERSMVETAVLGCVGVELGRLRGEGHGVSDPQIGTAFWSAARLEVGGGLRVASALRLAARVGVAAPFDRRPFELAGVPIHEPAALSLRAALGVDFLW